MQALAWLPLPRDPIAVPTDTDPIGSGPADTVSASTNIDQVDSAKPEVTGSTEVYSAPAARGLALACPSDTRSADLAPVRLTQT